MKLKATWIEPNYTVVQRMRALYKQKRKPDRIQVTLWSRWARGGRGKSGTSEQPPARPSCRGPGSPGEAEGTSPVALGEEENRGPGEQGGPGRRWWDGASLGYQCELAVSKRASAVHVLVRVCKLVCSARTRLHVHTQFPNLSATGLRALACGAQHPDLRFQDVFH